MVHHDQRELLGGCHDCVFYIATGLEKEAWCNVLRGASKPDLDAKKWYLKFKNKYENYCKSLEACNPFVAKIHPGNPTMGVYVEQPQPTQTSGPLLKQILWNALGRREANNNRDLAKEQDSANINVSLSSPQTSATYVAQGVVVMNMLTSRLFFDWSQSPKVILKYHTRLQVCSLLYQSSSFN